MINKLEKLPGEILDSGLLQYIVRLNVGYIILYICAVLDINECDLNTHNCSNNAQCLNTNGSFACNCSVGFSGNGVICEGKQTINFFWVYNNKKVGKILHFHEQTKKETLLLALFKEI